MTVSPWPTDLPWWTKIKEKNVDVDVDVDVDVTFDAEVLATYFVFAYVAF